jgi:hypothetical protein
MQSGCRSMFRLFLFAFVGSAAFAQNSESVIASTVPTAVKPPTTIPTELDLIDQVLGMVGPSEPSLLTERDRFRQYLLSAGGPVPLIGEAAAAGYGQWTNHPHAWGQGWGAFGGRYGSNLAYNGVRQTITYGASILFHEDTRYFASGRSGFWRRTSHAVLSTFTARHPDGGQRFSFSSVTGVVGASAISSIWGPDSWKGTYNIGENAGISFASTAVLNIIREALPNHLHRSSVNQTNVH